MRTGKDHQSLQRRIKRLGNVNDKLKQINSVQASLLELSELASKVQDLPQFYPALSHTITTILHIENFYIALESSDGELELAYFVDENDDSILPETMGLSSGITGLVHKTGRTVCCNKQEYRKMVETNQIKALGSEPELWFGVPLKRRNETIGVMAIQSYRSGASASKQTRLVFENLGLHLMTAINRVKRRELLEREVKKRTQQLQLTNKELEAEIILRNRSEKLQELLFKISEMSTASLPMAQFYAQLHKAISALMNVENCHIGLLHEGLIDYPFFKDNYASRVGAIAKPDGFAKFILDSWEARLILQDEVKELSQQGVDLQVNVNGAEKTCWLGAPLIVDNNIIGVITIHAYNHQYQYNDTDLLLLNFVSNQIASSIQRREAVEQLQRSHDSLEQKVLERTEALTRSNVELKLQIAERNKAEQKLFHQAHHDLLTGLPNRSLFQSRLQQVLAHAKRHPNNHFGLLFIDLDNFKRINDTLGHKIGDEFLIEVARRIEQCVRDNDLVARIGGDEFVVILDTLANRSFAEEVSLRIINSLQQPVTIANSEAQSGASIGIAFCESKHETIDAFIRDADLAMYQAKALGRGQYVVYCEELDDNVMEQESFCCEIKEAFGNNKIELNKEPIVSQSAELISCFLFNANLQLSRSGSTEIKELTHQIDSMELSLPLEYKVILKVLESLEKNDVGVLPISRKHLTHVKLVDELISLVANADSRLVLAFDESEVIEISDFEIKSLKRLRNKGVHIAIMNFGSHHAPFGILAKVAFDFVFISSRFVRSVYANPNDASLLNAVVAFCNAQQVRPVLMGIDTEDYWERAQSLGVELLSGHFVSDHCKTIENSLLFEHRA